MKGIVYQSLLVVSVLTEKIVSRLVVPAQDPTVFCCTVDRDHTMEANGIFTGQCDGDEDCVMLLMDSLLNFSMSYLPQRRGGKMDAPLVMTTRLNPAEVDKEAWNVAIAFLSFQPILPIEIGGFIAGAARMPIHTFLPALWIGKFPKYLVLIYLGSTLFRFIPLLR
jgi:hypothetical protein